MKPISCLLVCCLLLSALSARAQGTLNFMAQIDDENLAEEAILLLHCLSGRTDRSWEFTGEARGESWLKIQEKNHVLQGIYHVKNRETPFEMRAGESDKICNALEYSDSKPDIIPVPTLSPLVAEKNEDVVNKKTWLWVGLGAALVAGFFFWKSRQPNYSEIQMAN